VGEKEEEEKHSGTDEIRTVLGNLGSTFEFAILS
jgi:hypothetical protein